MQTKEQKKISQAAWYQRNKEVHKKNAFARKEIQRNILRQYVVSFLKEHPCVQCGEDDLVLLDFDHLDLETKRKNISQIVNCGNSLSYLISEIEKCQVLCVSCHRRKTAKQFNWYLRV